MEELWVALAYKGEGGVTLLVETCWGKRRQRNIVKKANINKSVKWEPFVYTVGIEGADLKSEALFQIFAAFCAAIEQWKAVADDIFYSKLVGNCCHFWRKIEVNQFLFLL